MTNFACWLSMAVGFLSLSQEILWVRIISFTMKAVSQTFALVLFCFLIGIAIGAAIGKRICERYSDLLSASTLVLAAAAIVDLSLLLLLPILSDFLWPLGFIGICLLVILTALLKSILFPIAHHIGSQQTGGRIGRSVSRVYFFNIVGATLGPIVTGYILLDLFTLNNCLLLVGLCTGLLSLMCAVQNRSIAMGLTVAGTLLPVVALALSSATNILPGIAIATQRQELMAGTRIDHMVQNREGIIYTAAPPNGEPDWTFGNNVYDGRLTLDMSRNINGLDRPLVLLGVHPKPERVLVIGLSTGAWARILSTSPRIKELVAVEINPGYVQVIRGYPQFSGLLNDPRVRIIIDDGRRWLRRNPNEKFDLIVMNTTFYWLAYSTNLLSREFMQLVSSHLKPGGIIAINTTYSSDVLETARQVFPFVERRANIAYGSKSDLSQPIPDAEQAYRELRLDGIPVFTESAFNLGGLARDMIDTPFMPYSQQYEGLTPNPGIITDQNLLVEHAHGLIRKKMPQVFTVLGEVRAFIHQ